MLSARNMRLIGLLLLLVLAFCLDIAVGSVRIPLNEVLKVLFTAHADNDTWTYIVSQIRIPKACTAVLAGSALSVSGLQMQTIFRNPLAEPSMLGVTAGAGLGVAAFMLSGGRAATLYSIRELGIPGSWLIITAACIGAALIMLLVLAVAGSIRNTVMMLIVGIMIGTITIAVISIWQYFSEPESIKDYLLWTFGSLGGTTGSQLAILAAVTFIGLIISFINSKMLDALLLGDNYALSVGVTAKRARFLVICSTSLLSGAVTAFCGPIGFVGIAVPHMARLLFSTADHRILIPGCCLIGTVLMLLADTLAQLPGSQTVLPINIIMSLIGGPIVIWIILKKSNLKAS